MCLASAATWCCRQDGLLLPVWAAGADAAVGGTSSGTAPILQQQQQQQYSQGVGCSELPMVWLQVRLALLSAASGRQWSDAAISSAAAAGN
jgi:hypothetical protein